MAPRLLALVILLCSEPAYSSFAYILICLKVLVCFLVGCFVYFVVLPRRRNGRTALVNLRPRFRFPTLILRPIQSRVAGDQPIENET